MRHKYTTSALVLGRTPLGEANILLTLLTSELGLVRARAQGLRKTGAKLASSLQSVSTCSIVLIRGKEGWRLAGAVLERAWARDLTPDARARAARVGALLIRLVPPDVHDSYLFSLFHEFMSALATLSPEDADNAELLVVLRLLHALGLDAGIMYGGETGFSTTSLAEVQSLRKQVIARVNHGIAISGL